MNDCKGIVGLFKGHNFEPIYENNQYSSKELVKIIEAIDRLTIYSSEKVEIVNKKLPKSINSKIIALCCTRCGLEQDLNNQFV